jgi:predicted ferric reductase
MADVSARQHLAGSRSVGRTRVRHSTSRTVAMWGVWLLALANVAVIVMLWWQGGNVTGVHTIGALFNSLGRITGLLGAYLLLIQVLLVARLPLFEWFIGFDRLTVWHRRNGKLCLYLVLAHVVFITIGYTLTDKVSIAMETALLLTNYPGMVEATIGTVLMVIIVVASLVIVRRHFRYETWYLVHLTAYLAILLGWFHQVPTGNEFLTNAPATAYWTALYLATLAPFVLYRFVKPVLRGTRHRLRVDEVKLEGPNVVSLRITGRHLDRLGARAGQFFLWRFLGPGRWWESHPFSLSAAPDGKSLRITVKSSGDFSSRIGEITPGTPVIAEGPFGRFTESVRRHDRVALIAGGIGITPIRALLEEMPGDLVLIYRVIRDEDIVFREELERLAGDRGNTIFYVVGDHAAPGGDRLLSSEHLGELVPDITDRDVYICGPPALSYVIERNVQRAGVPRSSIHTERFAL